jgi:hypothetical protein
MIWVRSFLVIGLMSLGHCLMAQASQDTLNSDQEMVGFDKGRRDRFRQIYNHYMKDKRLPVKCSYLMLNNLSRAGSTLETAEAFDCINSYLAILEQNQRTWREYRDVIQEELGNEFVAVFNLNEKQAEATWQSTRETCYSGVTGTLSP